MWPTPNAIILPLTTSKAGEKSTGVSLEPLGKVNTTVLSLTKDAEGILSKYRNRAKKKIP